MATETPLVYKTDGGDTQVVASGGKIRVESGGELELAAGAIATLADEILNGADIALADGKILIGDVGGAGAAKTPSGDVTMTREGVTAIGAKKVLEGMIAIADGKIFVGDAGGAASAVTPSGDVTITNTGVTAIGALKVTAAMLATAVTTMINGLRTWLADGMAAIATITVSAVTAVKFKTTTTAIYSILGLFYSKAATDELVFTANDTINNAAGAGTLWGIWLVQIDAAGTISTKPAAADMTYANEAAAIAALPAVDASNVQIGYLTVQALEATDWVANTDNLTVGGGAGNCTARSFYDLPAAKSLPAAL